MEPLYKEIQEVEKRCNEYTEKSHIAIAKTISNFMDEIKEAVKSLNQSTQQTAIDRGYYDFSNVAPDASNDFEIAFYLADQTGTANDPKLVVEHSSGTTFIPRVSFIM